MAHQQLRPTGSWVAIPTPFNEDDSVDFGGFRTLVDHHLEHGTSELFVMGSAGEVSLLAPDERREIVVRLVEMTKGRIPVFFGATFPTTAGSAEFARFAQSEGADGLVFLIPPYLLPPQTAVLDHFRTCMSAVEIPVGVYNNPSRVGVPIEADTLVTLAREFPHFVVDKEAMGDVGHLVEVKRRLGDRLNLLCCDYPKYSIVLPTMALGGDGTANIGGNIIPAEMAAMSRPWTSLAQVEEARRLYLHWYPLLEALYWFSNPIVIKAALRILGLPAGSCRRPNPELEGERLARLELLMKDLGVIEAYGAG